MLRPIIDSWAPLLAATNGDVGSGPSLRSAVALFLITALALLVGLVVLVLAVLGRRRRRQRAARDDDEPTPTADAWAESGKRVRPYRNR